MALEVAAGRAPERDLAQLVAATDWRTHRAQHQDRVEGRLVALELPDRAAAQVVELEQELAALQAEVNPSL